MNDVRIYKGKLPDGLKLSKVLTDGINSQYYFNRLEQDPPEIMFEKAIEFCKNQYKKKGEIL